jgi:hypothetical protein
MSEVHLYRRYSKLRTKAPRLLGVGIPQDPSEIEDVPAVGLRLGA